MTNNKVEKITLFDSSGNKCDVGDLVRVEMPEYRYYGDCEMDADKSVYGAEKTIYGTIHVRLTEGVGINVTKVDCEDDLNDDLPVLKKWMKLKLRKYKFYKV